MPLLIPSAAPPQYPNTKEASTPSSAGMFGSILTSSHQPLPSEAELTGANEICGSLPIAQLDMEVISDAVAAKLAASLLGHVLFLKGQVPL